MNKFTFSNKEEYLAYRQAWKAEYKELTKTIREIKWAKKFISKTANKNIIAVGGIERRHRAWCEYFDLVDKDLKGNERFQSISNLVKCDLYTFKHKQIAIQMLIDLKLAKVESERQYQEHKNLVLA